MNIENLFSLIRSEKKELVKDYYDQVKSGITDSNTKMWKFIMLSGVIVICYFLFSQKIIANVKLSIVSLDNPEVISLLTPPFFTLSYLMYSLHTIRYRRLLIEYELITNHIGNLIPDELKQDQTNHVLPVNFFDNIMNLFISVNSTVLLLLNFFLMLPFLFIQSLAITFIIYCVVQIWNVGGLIFWTSIIFTLWITIIILVISSIAYMQNKKNKQYIRTKTINNFKNA